MTLMLWLYNLVLLLGAILFWPLWSGYLVLRAKARAGFMDKLGWYREDTFRQLEACPADSPTRRIWFHAVSVGEFNAIRPLIDDLGKDYTILISTTTQTAQELAKRLYPHHCVFYFPFDFRPVIHRILQRMQPELIILTETELWPNFIDIASRRCQIPVILINGRISKRSYKGYKLIQPLIGHTLSQLEHLYMQSQGDADRIRDLGDLPMEQITVVGNLKFDIHPVVDPMQRTILSHLLSFGPHDTVLTFASTHSGEDGPLIDVYAVLRRDFPELKLILAPRHPERRDEIRDILNAKAMRYSVRSMLSEENPNREDIVVLDSIGELVTIYSLSNIAVLGGSFGDRGGQNPLEAVSQRVPVIFGPNMSNFTEISQMILDQEAGYQAQTFEEVGQYITQLLTQPEQCSTVVENGQQLLENNRGTKEILSIAIRQLLHDPHALDILEY